MLVRYVLRNIASRWDAVLPAAFAIMAAVGVTTTMLGVIEGLRSALYESGPPLNAIVASKGVNDELSSGFPLAEIGRIKAQSGIAASATGAPMVSPEFVASYRFRSAHSLDVVVLRGVDPIALDVHSGVRIEGSLPKSGENALVIGSRRVDAMPDFHLGGKVRIGKLEWTVTGILHAPGTIFESEIWADRSALQNEFQRPDVVSVAYVRLADRAALPALNTAISRDQSVNVVARYEREFNSAKYASAAVFIKVSVAVTILLGIAAVFTATNALFTLFLAKVTEIGTLMAIGYSRRRVAGILLQEAFLIAGLGGLGGVLVALMTNGHPVSFEGVSLVFTVAMTSRVIAAGLGATAVIGVLASVAILVNAWRLDVLQALRSA